jgi:hypothetical protein
LEHYRLIKEAVQLQEQSDVFDHAIQNRLEQPHTPLDASVMCGSELRVINVDLGKCGVGAERW